MTRFTEEADRCGKAKKEELGNVVYEGVKIKGERRGG